MGSTVSPAWPPVQDQGRQLTRSPSACAPARIASAMPWSRSNWANKTSYLPAAVKKSIGARVFLFDAMGALSTQYNDTPESLARYDAKRDGFVIAGGGGMVCRRTGTRPQAWCQDLCGNHRLRRNLRWLRHGCPERRRVQFAACQALATVDTPIDYLNTHGTSTPVGDVAESRAVREVFGAKGASHQARPRACPVIAGRRRRAGSDLLHADDGRQSSLLARSTLTKSTRKS